MELNSTNSLMSDVSLLDFSSYLKLTNILNLEKIGDIII